MHNLHRNALAPQQDARVPFSQGIVRHSFYIQLLCSLDVVRQRYGDNDN